MSDEKDIYNEVPTIFDDIEPPVQGPEPEPEAEPELEEKPKRTRKTKAKPKTKAKSKAKAKPKTRKPRAKKGESAEEEPKEEESGLPNDPQQGSDGEEDIAQSATPSEGDVETASDADGHQETRSSDDDLEDVSSEDHPEEEKQEPSEEAEETEDEEETVSNGVQSPSNEGEDAGHEDVSNIVQPTTKNEVQLGNMFEDDKEEVKALFSNVLNGEEDEEESETEPEEDDDEETEDDPDTENDRRQMDYEADDGSFIRIAPGPVKVDDETDERCPTCSVCGLPITDDEIYEDEKGNIVCGTCANKETEGGTETVEKPAEESDTEESEENTASTPKVWCIVEPCEDSYYEGHTVAVCPTEEIAKELVKTKYLGCDIVEMDMFSASEAPNSDAGKSESDPSQDNEEESEAETEDTDEGPEPEPEPEEEPLPEPKGIVGILKNYNAKVRRGRQAKNQASRDRRSKRKHKKDDEYDPDSVREKLRRWYLWRFKGYVKLRTISRMRNGEYKMETTLVKFKDLPREAVACTGERGYYCNDTIRNSDWYYANHIKQTGRLEDQFTASDACLFMLSNKIDNALAINWTEKNHVDFTKIVLIIGVVLVVALIVVTRM